jgi:serine/threonine protein kinase
VTTVVLKTYQGKDAEKSWTNEVQTFQKLHAAGSSPNVIGFYTAFKHGSTWHCILEYADRGSLGRYLQSNIPPKDGLDIARFWKRVLGLVRGLKDLHNGHEVM